MIKAGTMNQPIILPRINLGWLWSFLKVLPVRPNAPAQQAVIVAAIKDEGDRVPQGYVFHVREKGYFFASVGEATGELHSDQIEPLSNPHHDIINTSDSSKRHSNIQPSHKLVLSLDSIPTDDANVKKAVVEVFYGKRAPQKLAELSLA